MCDKHRKEILSVGNTYKIHTEVNEDRYIKLVKQVCVNSSPKGICWVYTHKVNFNILTSCSEDQNNCLCMLLEPHQILNRLKKKKKKDGKAAVQPVYVII